MDDQKVAGAPFLSSSASSFSSSPLPPPPIFLGRAVGNAPAASERQAHGATHLEQEVSALALPL